MIHCDQPDTLIHLCRNYTIQKAFEYGRKVTQPVRLLLVAYFFLYKYLETICLQSSGKISRMTRVLCVFLTVTVICADVILCQENLTPSKLLQNPEDNSFRYLLKVRQRCANNARLDYRGRCRVVFKMRTSQ